MVAGKCENVMDFIQILHDYNVVIRSGQVQQSVYPHLRMMFKFRKIAMTQEINMSNLKN